MAVRWQMENGKWQMDEKAFPPVAISICHFPPLPPFPYNRAHDANGRAMDGPAAAGVDQRFFREKRGRFAATGRGAAACSRAQRPAPQALHGLRTAAVGEGADELPVARAARGRTRADRVSHGQSALF